MRTNRLADARTALKHLPAEPATPAEIHRLSAWLAAACGDLESERRELASLVAEAPEDFEALGRLETLELREAAKRLSRSCGDGGRRSNAPRRDIASSIGAISRPAMPRRWPDWPNGWADPFEAMVFLTAAMADEPDRADLREALHRLQKAAHKPDDTGRSLFDRLRLTAAKRAAEGVGPGHLPDRRLPASPSFGPRAGLPVTAPFFAAWSASRFAAFGQACTPLASYSFAWGWATRAELERQPASPWRCYSRRCRSR